MNGRWLGLCGALVMTVSLASCSSKGQENGVGMLNNTGVCLGLPDLYVGSAAVSAGQPVLCQRRRYGKALPPGGIQRMGAAG